MEKCNKMDIEDTPKRVGKNKNNSNFIPMDEEKKLLNQKN